MAWPEPTERDRSNIAPGGSWGLRIPRTPGPHLQDELRHAPHPSYQNSHSVMGGVSPLRGPGAPYPSAVRASTTGSASQCCGTPPSDSHCPRDTEGEAEAPQDNWPADTHRRFQTSLSPKPFSRNRLLIGGKWPQQAQIQHPDHRQWCCLQAVPSQPGYLMARGALLHPNFPQVTPAVSLNPSPQFPVSCGLSEQKLHFPESLGLGMVT